MVDKYLIGVSEYRASEVYQIKIKDYGNGLIDIIEYDTLIKRKKPGYEVRENNNPDFEYLLSSTRITDSKKKIKKNEVKSIRRNNLNRSFSLLSDLILANREELKTFVTLTFADNVTDLNYANNEFNKLNKAIRKHYPNYKYIAVPEFQKRGAVHYHMLMNLGLEKTKVFEVQENGKYYSLKQWNKHGFSSVFDLSKTDDNFNLLAYMGKYFFKDIDNRLFGRQKVLRSQNCKMPKVNYYRKNDIQFNDFLRNLDNAELINNRKVLVCKYDINEITYKTYKIPLT